MFLHLRLNNVNISAAKLAGAYRTAMCHIKYATMLRRLDDQANGMRKKKKKKELTTFEHEFLHRCQTAMQKRRERAISEYMSVPYCQATDEFYLRAGGVLSGHVGCPFA